MKIIFKLFPIFVISMLLSVSCVSQNNDNNEAEKEKMSGFNIIPPQNGQYKCIGDIPVPKNYSGVQ